MAFNADLAEYLTIARPYMTLQEVSDLAATLEGFENFKERKAKSKDGLSAETIAFIEDGKVIYAIKQHRTETGLGLKESKEAVDAYRVAHGLTSYA